MGIVFWLQVVLEYIREDVLSIIVTLVILAGLGYKANHWETFEKAFWWKVFAAALVIAIVVQGWFFYDVYDQVSESMAPKSKASSLLHYN